MRESKLRSAPRNKRAPEPMYLQLAAVQLRVARAGMQPTALGQARPKERAQRASLCREVADVAISLGSNFNRPIHLK